MKTKKENPGLEEWTPFKPGEIHKYCLLFNQKKIIKDATEFFIPYLIRFIEGGLFPIGKNSWISENGIMIKFKKVRKDGIWFMAIEIPSEQDGFQYCLKNNQNGLSDNEKTD